MPDDGLYHHAASYGFSPRIHASISSRIRSARTETSLVGRACSKAGPSILPDVLADPNRRLPSAQKEADIRTVLGVPLLREGVPIGVLMLARTTVRPFTDKQIELVATFADQAVIAIENVRLFDEVPGAHARTVRGAGAADGDLRGAWRHQQLAGRAGAGVPGNAGECGAALRGQIRDAVSL